MHLAMFLCACSAARSLSKVNVCTVPSFHGFTCMFYASREHLCGKKVTCFVFCSDCDDYFTCDAACTCLFTTLLRV